MRTSRKLAALDHTVTRGSSDSAAYMRSRSEQMVATVDENRSRCLTISNAAACVSTLTE